MLGRTHIAIGFLAGLLLEPFFDPSSKTAYYVVVLIGSVLPDIDHEGSMINNLLPLTKYAAKIMHHRGIFHTIFMPILLAVLASYLIVPAYGWFLLVGYMSHLLSDSLTHLGVNWLHPFSEQKISGPVTTGTWMETLVLWGTMFFIAVKVF